MKINKQHPFKSHTKTFFNLTQNSSLDSISPVLSYGLKHIPKPGDVSDSELNTAFQRFRNSTLWKIYFSTRNIRLEVFDDIDDEDSDNFNPKLTLPGKPMPRPCNFIRDSHPAIQALNNMEQDLHDYQRDFPTRKGRSKQLKELEHIKKDFPNVIFKPADKNLGMVALSLHAYNDLVLFHLANEKNYELCADDPLSVSQLLTRCKKDYFKFAGILNNIPTFEGFTQAELKFLRTTRDRTFNFPHFYVLPKLHKNGPIKGRPIAGAVNWITTPLSLILDCRLQEAVKCLPYVLKNSQTLVNELTSPTSIPKDLRFVVGDVESLYPNVQIGLLIKIFLARQEISHLSPLVSYVCTNSYVQYNNRVYRQRDGIAMGTNCAVSLANIYMDHLVDRMVSKFSDHDNENFCVLGYKRYIDDLFLVISSDETKWEHFKMKLSKLEPFKIKINWEEPSATSINFLDVKIWQSPFDSRIHTSIHQKELNKYLYISRSSSHAPHTFSGFLKGELTRYSRLCSDVFTYRMIKDKFYQRLRLRGYSHKFLGRIFKSHNWSARFNEQSSKEKVIPFVIPFTNRSNIKRLRTSFYRTSKILKTYLPQHNPMFVYSRTRNIKDLLCSSSLTPEQQKHLPSDF